MYSEKTISVGIDGQYLTLNEAFKHHRRGRLHIILTSDVFDEKDIFIPSSLIKLHITTHKKKSIGFYKKHITIHCNGVPCILEDIGKENSGLVVIGTKRDTRAVSIFLNRCHVDYVIGAHNVENVNELCLEIRESKIESVTGFLNHDYSLTCQSMTIDIDNTTVNILQTINITGKNEKATLTLHTGSVRINDSTITEIMISKAMTTNNQELPIKVMVGGASVITKGIS
ncbi:hypothetical protein ACWG0P_05605 [Amedibacillus sp. YH-ame6]